MKRGMLTGGRWRRRVRCMRTVARDSRRAQAWRTGNRGERVLYDIGSATRRLPARYDRQWQADLRPSAGERFHLGAAAWGGRRVTPPQSTDAEAMPLFRRHGRGRRDLPAPTSLPPTNSTGTDPSSTGWATSCLTALINRTAVGSSATLYASTSVRRPRRRSSCSPTVRSPRLQPFSCFGARSTKSSCHTSPS